VKGLRAAPTRAPGPGVDRGGPRRASRRHALGGLLVAAIGLLAGCRSEALEAPAEATAPPEPVSRRSVLLVCIDDLRPELGSHGARHAVTPHLDAFAATALRFDRHYVQHPTCGASRFSMLTGRGPTEPAHFGNGAFATLDASSDPAASLPGAFRAAGYRTVVLGKVSHSHDGRAADGSQELPGAWDELPTEPGPWKEARHLLHGYGGGRARVTGRSPISERAFDDDLDYPDAHLAEQAVRALERLARAEQPFLLAVGFFKPHLPFAAPRPYWDLYDRDALPLSPAPEAPADLPAVHGVHQSGEVTRNYLAQGYEGRWSTSARRHLRHGYLAATSYVDAQVGRLLGAVDELGLTDELIVVVWGDHGWHLGDLGLFGKHTPYEASLRSVLMLRVPGTTLPGSSTEALVESRQLFPTLAGLCGVPLPDALRGGMPDLAPLLTDPAAPGLRTAESWWRRGDLTAHSVRTRSYRAITWRRADGAVASRELYDLSATSHELRNLDGIVEHELAHATELGLIGPGDIE
jgi:iduronate 2-sulfatase